MDRRVRRVRNRRREPVQGRLHPLVREDRQVPAPEVGEAAEWGNIRARDSPASKALGQPVVKSTGTFRHPFLDCVKANPDGFVVKCERGSPLVEGSPPASPPKAGRGRHRRSAVPCRIQVTMQNAVHDSVFAHVARLYHRMAILTSGSTSLRSASRWRCVGRKGRRVLGLPRPTRHPSRRDGMSLSALGKIGRESVSASRSRHRGRVCKSPSPR